ncbi:MAG: alpha/beta hydrolase [Thioalkalispiraceae bacterium]|jgi:pimeloyl-ACP methyl ester carboxylesterase
MITTSKTLIQLLFSLLLLSLSVAACAANTNSYYIDEPVFGGQSYIVEAGKQNRELVVLVHGLGDKASDTWARMIPKLAKRYHVVSFDLPGFGRSSKSNQLYSPDNYVAFINYLVKKIGYDEFMLVGHSMGGNIALRFASTYPYKVKRLMLVDAAGVLHRVTYTTFFTHYGIQMLPQFYAQQGRDIRSVAGAILGELARRHNILEAGEEMVLADPALRQKFMGGNPTTIAAYAMMMTDYSKTLDSMKVPTLILWGAEDDVIPLRTGKVLATNLPIAGLIVLDNAGHVPMRDEPLIFANWLRRFVSESEDSFQALLKQKRYRIDTNRPNRSKRIANCKNSSNLTFAGDYRLITIDNCRDITIDTARIGSLTIRNSQVVLNNCEIESVSKAVMVVDSDVQINGCSISGNPALEFDKSQLDIAGTRLISSGPALKNADDTPPVQQRRPGPLAVLDSNDTTLIFSVSSMSSKYYDKLLHGPVNFKPEQAW